MEEKTTLRYNKENNLFSFYYKDIKERKAKYLEKFNLILKSERHAVYRSFLCNIFLLREKEQDSTTIKNYKKIDSKTKNVLYDLPYLKRMNSNIETIKEILLIDEFMEEEIAFEVLVLLPFASRLETLILNNIPLGIKALFPLFCDSLKFVWNLKHLSLANCKLYQAPDFKEFSKSLCFLKHLVYLNLSCNELNSIMLYKIFTFEYTIEDYNENSETLDSISGPEIDKFDEIQVFSYVYKLGILNISYDYCRDHDTPSSLYEENKFLFLTLISQLNILKELHLCNLGLGMSMNALAQIVNKLTNLEKLDLSSNYITDYNFSMFVNEIVCCKNLKDLQLANNMIESGGFILLMDNMNKFKSLSLLNFERNHITRLYDQNQMNYIIPIENFNISHNSFVENLEEFKRIFAFLMRFRKINTFIAKNCGIDNNCFEFIIENINSCTRSLYYFDLRRNNFDIGIKNVIDAHNLKMEWFAKLLLKPKQKKQELTMYLRTCRFKEKFL